MKLEELQVCQLSMELGEKVWEVVIDWDYFLKDTVGKQLLKSVDSIAANLSEGFGRYFYKENKQLCYYSRGSLFETKTWLTKVRNRNLISEEQFKNFSKDIDLIGKKLNSYIKSIGTQSSIDQFQNNQKQND